MTLGLAAVVTGMGAESIQQFFPAGFKPGLALAKWLWDKRAFPHLPNRHIVLEV